MFIKSKVSKSALAAVFAGVAMFSTQSANAVDANATLNVSATVQSACAFGTVASPATVYSLNFGTFTVGATGPGSDKSASVPVAVECAAATSYTIGADGTVGSRTMTGPGVPVLKYELYSDAAFTTALGNIGTAGAISSGGATTGATHTIYGLIPQAGNTGATPGAYTDVVILTLRF
jgi:spore coat protein U-like protein